MTSSISNSNRRGVIAGLSVLLGVGILLGFDQYTYSEHEDLVEDAVEKITQDPPVIPIIQLTPTLETEITFNHELLEKKHHPSILFLGNSVVQTSIVPPVFHEKWNLLTDTRVTVFALSGASTVTVAETLLQSGWRPEVVIMDLAPRSYTPLEKNRVRAVMQGSIDKPVSTQTRQAQWTNMVENMIAREAAEVIPTFDLGIFVPSVVLQGKAVQDGFRHGFLAYQCAVLGNVTAVLMSDGSVRITALNQTPGMNRFYDEMITWSLHLIRKGSVLAKTTIEHLLGIATTLSEKGTKVILVRMPLSKPLYDLDEELNAGYYQDLEERCQNRSKIEYRNLSDDEELRSLPYFDGHHRMYTTAKRASLLIAERLEDLIPGRLKNR